MAIIFRIDSRVQQVAKRVVEHCCKVSIIELGLQVVVIANANGGAH